MSQHYILFCDKVFPQNENMSDPHPIHSENAEKNPISILPSDSHYAISPIIFIEFAWYPLMVGQIQLWDNCNTAEHQYWALTKLSSATSQDFIQVFLLDGTKSGK